MRFFLLLIGALVAGSFPAFAQDMLREHRQGDPMAKLLDKDAPQPESVNDYANIYYKSCVNSDKTESVQDYVQMQCACSATKMTEFMTMEDMKALFTKTKEGNFQEGRVMMLAYMPCLYDSIYNMVFDECFYDNKNRTELKQPRKVCECYGKNMGNYVAAKGEYLVPGFVRGGFQSERSVPDVFSHIIQSNLFTSMADEHLKRCLLTTEYGWGK